MRLIAPLLFLACLVASASTPPSADQKKRALEIDSFQFLGCSGDWQGGGPSADVWRAGSSRGITYLVRHADTCGADAARNPKASLANGVLDLQYEAYSTSDVYAACLCEYWATFTFKADQDSVDSATFRGRAANLKGEWPRR